MGDGSKYLDCAEETARWLREMAVVRGEGLAWPSSADRPDDVRRSLGWGGLGPIVFFADLFRTTGDRADLEVAEAGAAWARAILDEDASKEPWGLFTGLGGLAVVFAELHRATGEADHLQTYERVVRAIADAAVPADDGLHWHETTEILWGTAGLGCVLLDAVDRLGDDALEAARGAGAWLVARAEPVEPGLRWSLGDGPCRDQPFLAPVRFPNFAHGTAGIAFFLTRLARATGEERFLAAALAGAEWVLSTCDTKDRGCKAYHHGPGEFSGPFPVGPARDQADHSLIYTFGWCHGPPGLGWFFRELELATGDSEWSEWIARTARSVRTSGVPEQREPGFWDNLGRCCGSASVAEYFLDLHSWRGDADDLSFARTVVDDMIERATVDDHGMRFSNVEFRADPPVLSAETTFLQGAAGIGATLTRLARHLEGDESVIRFPHAPTWT